jgi:phosphate transport system permease protein
MTLSFLLPLVFALLCIAALRAVAAVRPRIVFAEAAVVWILRLCAAIALLTTAGIFLSVLFESLRFFSFVPLREFLFGLEWSPQIAIREGQIGARGAFGAAPVFVGTILISAVALAIAAPLGLLCALYLALFAAPHTRALIKPALEILAGVPTVVYGFFAVVFFAPLITGAAAGAGFVISPESALVAGLVMGMMLIPFVASLAEDAVHSVPAALREGALALGATRAECALQVVLPAALPGVVGGLLLATSRALGETMIVLMAAGLAANLSANPLEATTTVTVQIVTMLTGDQEFDDPKTLAAFALGLALFAATLILNACALGVLKKYRSRYERH